MFLDGVERDMFGESVRSSVRSRSCSAGSFDSSQVMYVSVIPEVSCPAAR